MKKKVRNEKRARWESRRRRVRKGRARSMRPALTVYRSSKHIYAQIDDPGTGQTLATASSRSKGVVGEAYPGNVEAAKKVGTAIAKLAQEKNIREVVFNRNGFLYHGRVKALADAAREAGLDF
ncbi:MAG: 50S ribosomal protein L18 [Proteobacteria bacterium]|nr:50S ribosomal protein L18 [Pseudomonadota bacterium]